MAGDDFGVVFDLGSRWPPSLSFDGIQPDDSVCPLIPYTHATNKAHLLIPSNSYISDVGAQKLKPLFIAMGSASVLLLDLAFLLERWLRHRGRLAANTSRSQKVLSILASIAAVAGGAGLILLSIFDTWRHHKMHDAFLTLFIAGYVIAAVFICAEYQRLGLRYREFRILRISFWIKLAFIVTEVSLAIGTFFFFHRLCSRSLTMKAYPYIPISIGIDC
jgi:hypothetical protein